MTEKYPAGTVIKIKIAPVREGYTFTYWKGSEYRVGDEYTVSEDHELVAQEQRVNRDGSFVHLGEGCLPNG